MSLMDSLNQLLPYPVLQGKTALDTTVANFYLFWGSFTARGICNLPEVRKRYNNASDFFFKKRGPLTKWRFQASLATFTILKICTCTMIHQECSLSILPFYLFVNSIHSFLCSFSGKNAKSILPEQKIRETFYGNILWLRTHLCHFAKYMNHEEFTLNQWSFTHTQILLYPNSYLMFESSNCSYWQLGWKIYCNITLLLVS